MGNTKKNILILAMSITISIVTVEFLLRIFETENFDLLTRVNEDQMVVHRPDLDMYHYDNESKKKVHIKTNGLGFIGSNFEQEKPDDVLRIAVLGDSYTAAVQVDYEDSYVFLLNKEMNEDIKKQVSSTFKKVEVMNFGVGGMGTVDQMKYYNKYVRRFHPDVVVLSLYLGNDIWDNSFYYDSRNIFLSEQESWNIVPQYSAVQYQEFTGLKDKLYRNFAIIRFMDRVVRIAPALNTLAIQLGLYRSPAGDGDFYDLGIPFWTYYYLDPLTEERASHVRFSSELINNLKNELNKDGVKFGVMLIPDGMTTDQDLLEAFKDRYPKLRDYTLNSQAMETRFISYLDPSVRVLELRRAMENRIRKGSAMYINGTGHFTEAGHMEAAEKLKEFIFALIK